ncbi:MULTISPECIES: hypothetical protein [unclassified Akkermansia]|nr:MULTISPECIES: hypothetical protein [unclassified Akkermansia]
MPNIRLSKVPEKQRNHARIPSENEGRPAGAMDYAIFESPFKGVLWIRKILPLKIASL